MALFVAALLLFAAPSSDSAASSSLELSPMVVEGINVRAAGAKGDGNANDTVPLQQLIGSHPTATLYFPAGTYRLHNAGINTPGLNFEGFSGTIRMASGAKFSCDTASTEAGQCLLLSRTNGATFDNVTITYRGLSGLPMRREAAISNALLVQNSQNVTFTNLTITGSTGSGAWNTDSTNITYAGSTKITQTTADGLHFENVGDASVASLYTKETGDDALGVTNIAQTNPNCGLTVASAQLHNSHSRGIAVAGGCNVIVSNIQITGTKNSALSVTQDQTINSRIPTNVKFSQAVISSVGTMSGVSGQAYCVEVSNGTYVSVANVSCADSADTGVFVYSNAAHVLVQNVTLKSAGNNGFQSAGASDVSFINDKSNNASGNGFDVEGSSQVVLQNCQSDNIAGYGFFHSGSSNVTESSLIARNVAISKGNNRAWWAERMTGPISVNGLTVGDDQSNATGYVVGDALDSAESVTVSNIAFQLKNGSASVQRGASNSNYFLMGKTTPVLQ